MSNYTQGWVADLEPNNRGKVWQLNDHEGEYSKVKVPLRKCNGKSITPRVATSHQSLKRGKKEVKLVAQNWFPLSKNSRVAQAKMWKNCRHAKPVE